MHAGRETFQLHEQPVVPGHRVRHLPSSHRLRATFASAAHEAEVPPVDRKVLSNHALPGMGDVTEGYLRPSVEPRRKSTEAIGAFLKERMERMKQVRSTRFP